MDAWDNCLQVAHNLVGMCERETIQYDIGLSVGKQMRYLTLSENIKVDLQEEKMIIDEWGFVRSSLQQINKNM